MAALQRGTPEDSWSAQAVLAISGDPGRADLAPLVEAPAPVPRAYAQVRLGIDAPRHRPRAAQPELDRALQQLGPALTGLLELPAPTLREADADFADYYRTELAPRLAAEGHGVANDDVLALNLDRDPEDELCVTARWKDTYFAHGLRFLAVFDRLDDRWAMSWFQRLPAAGTIDDAWAADLDGDGRREIVIAWCVATGHPVFQLTVLSHTGESWGVHSLSSVYRPATVLSGSSHLGNLVVRWRDGPASYLGAVEGEVLRWTPAGFSPQGPLLLPW